MSNSVEVGLAKSTGMIGIAAGLCGLGNCICGFIWLGYNGYGGHGLWSGFGLIFAALLGIFVWRYRNKTLMIFFLVSCIILVIIVGVQAAIAALGYIFWRLFRVATDCQTYGGTCHCRNSKGEPIPIDLETCDVISSIDSMFLAMTIFSACGTIVTLAGSIVGCMGTCCARNQQPGAVVVVQQPSGTQSSVLYTTTQHPAEGYPAQYPQAHSGQYPQQQYPQYPAPSVGQYPPPQYPAASGQGENPGGEAIPPKA
ncbi:hypothetical protein ACROYT_G009631 [Oculina patagonica]